MRISAIVPIEGEYKSIETFMRRHPKAVIESVDDKGSIGECEFCGMPILEGDEYYQWSGDDAIQTCLKCGGAHKKHKLVTA